ncbi:chromatin assembly factor 1 subunit FAS1-like isoform X1 [Olea europaea var. sylvestris]|uniref:chromatin assembly factor 1 subunit FAS1-like isoform X1 n=1 Tax=Olea europaea var. sylvestris TaxID=158386 RepID=UPI000C1CE967|nr:chromatin assembly factor 1 subunit FAS1-like isoform X1 [Olea europaea var. sylvestris]
MAEVEPMIIDGTDENSLKSNGAHQKNKASKRKRGDQSVCTASPEEKEAKINGFREEINSLIKFCKKLVLEQRMLLENVEKIGISSASLNGVIACLMEESELPLSKLVDDIFEKVTGKTGNGDSVSKASVKNSVLLVGQRLCYGVSSADADILEDESESALWYWETRDLKLVPKSMRGTLKVRRTCRKKIHERITAVLAMITALEKSEVHQSYREDLIRASDKLSKVLTEADVRLLMETMSQKNAAEVSEKEAKREEKLLIKQMEKSKRQMEKERKRMDRELNKEKLQTEKELKRLKDEAEKEELRLEKEESEMRKQLKRQQEEAEKERRRKEKEESELKKQLSLRKQASLMERFLKKNRTNSTSQNGSTAIKQVISEQSPNSVERMSGPITVAMDSVLTLGEGFDEEDIWKSHLRSWRCLGCTVRSNRKMHWGVRQKPKTELVKELKLSTNRELTCDEDLSLEKLVDGWDDSNIDGRSTCTNANILPKCQKRSRNWQLLQFDKSHRPAFYGVWSKKSSVVGARHPFAKDPDLDYEIDSDGEWEEEEPGESLSDCDKDDEDEMAGHSRGDDGDESEDGFFVPDGYLSENEGVHDDEIESDKLIEETRNLLDSGQNEEFCTLLRQQKYLNNLTEHALRKNHPLIIWNLMHEKAILVLAEGLTDAQKFEQKCLQSLSILPYPGCPPVEISICNDTVHEDEEASPSSSKSSMTPAASAVAILNSDLPQIVSVIQSCSQSIGKVLESLQNKFPTIPKSQLRNRVREISEFSDNRWQVKKEILAELGLSVSPEKSCGKNKSIAKFFSKRCLPPSGKTSNLIETSSYKAAAAKPQQDSSIIENQ